jgi:hypothetical protein
MIWRLAAAAFLTLCLAALGLQQPRAQFNGCAAGFCTPTVAAAAGPVVFDAFATAAVNVTGTSITSNNQTVGAGTKRALVVGLAIQTQSTAASVTCNWDTSGTNQAMTQIISANLSGVTGTMQLWGLVNPTSGNKTLTCQWTGSQQANMASASFTGVNSAGGATSFPNSASANGNSTAIALAITNVANGIIVDAAGSINTLSAPTQPAMTPLTNTGAVGLGMSRSSASATFGWTVSPASAWGDVGTAISP